MAAGRFITFEGGEGVGKTTQIRLLAEALRAGGLEIVTTREPGGSPGAEAIRSLLLDSGADQWDPTSEALLIHAARRDHLVRTIRPALERGAWVLCDRFEDSTRAYQGAGGLGMATIDVLSRIVCDGLTPDLTVILDLTVAEGHARAKARALAQGDIATDRFEARGSDFHEKVRACFLAIAAAEPQRCVVIDAAPDIEGVTAAVRQAVKDRLGV
jgi:dTMP kinase